MRTKALLCLAALAAGVATSVAQSNVYSLNIVGYVNVNMPLGNQVYANPLSAGVSNGANEVFSFIPDGTFVNKWTGAGFHTYYYDTTIGASANNWYLGDASTPGPIPTMHPGEGFFMNPGLAFTATFVGNVVPAPGTTNSLAIPLGNQLLGSPLPVGGYVTNSGPGAFNLPLSDGTFVNRWTGAGYQTYYYDTTIGASANNWYLGDASTPGPVPQFSVAQGFFMNPGLASVWLQTITNSP